MSLSLQEKFKWFQDSKYIIDNIDLYESVIRKKLKINNNVIFQTYQKIDFLSNNQFLNGSILQYKHIKNDYNQYTNDHIESYNNYHLLRNKKDCVVLIGNNLLHNVQDIETTLISSFQSTFAQLLDTDLYAWQVPDTNNTCNILQLNKILSYLQNYNYTNVKVVFQFLDPVKCFTSDWWDPSMYITNELTEQEVNVFKKHMSYHFTDYEKINDFVSKTNGNSFFMDSFVINPPKKNNSFYFLNMHEFFQIYEWSIFDMLNYTLLKFKNKFNSVKCVVWRDFTNTLNNNLHLQACDICLSEFVKQNKTDIKYSNDQNLYQEMMSNDLYLDINNSSPIVKFYNTNRVYFPLLNGDDHNNRYLISNNPNKFESGEDVEYYTHEDVDVNTWANYIVSQTNWLTK